MGKLYVFTFIPCVVTDYSSIVLGNRSTDYTCIQSQLFAIAATTFTVEVADTSTTALTANPSVVVPVRVANGWILMQRKVPSTISVYFNQPWANYRDGFGSITGDDNYWLGLDKIYHLVQLGNLKLRVEVGSTY